MRTACALWPCIAQFIFHVVYRNGKAKLGFLNHRGRQSSHSSPRREAGACSLTSPKVGMFVHDVLTLAWPNPISMENQIKKLKISNFKSIREAELDCGRINLFVGKPNVGKSNLLEAVSLLGFDQNKSDKFFSDFIRYNKLSNLFFYQNRTKGISIDADEWFTKIQFNPSGNNYELIYKTPHPLKNAEPFFEVRSTLEESGNLHRISEGVFHYCPVRKYDYKEKSEINAPGHNYLNTPNGNNLFWILQTSKKLKEEIPDMFEEYGLEFLIDLEYNEFAVQRKENGIVYKVPYPLIADTLQRIIFHYAAIFSNKDSVILFEEPESHMFGPYVRELALKIVESTDNQYFITTHSPYLFYSITENAPPKDLAIFLTYFEDYETKFKKLDDDEISRMMDFGIEIFFNLNHFINEQGVANPA